MKISDLQIPIKISVNEARSDTPVADFVEELLKTRHQLAREVSADEPRKFVGLNRASSYPLNVLDLTTKYYIDSTPFPLLDRYGKRLIGVTGTVQMGPTGWGKPHQYPLGKENTKLTLDYETSLSGLFDNTEQQVINLFTPRVTDVSDIGTVSAHNAHLYFRGLKSYKGLDQISVRFGGEVSLSIPFIPNEALILPKLGGLNTAIIKFTSTVSADDAFDEILTKLMLYNRNNHPGLWTLGTTKLMPNSEKFEPMQDLQPKLKNLSPVECHDLIADLYDEFVVWYKENVDE